MPYQPDHPCSRRLFLLGSATTLAGAVLAACGGDANKAASISVGEVPVGSATITDHFIIAQPTPGNFVAYSSVCPHQQAPITVVEGATVKCTKHGSQFNVKDGSVVHGPARSPLTKAQAKVEGDTVTAS